MHHARRFFTVILGVSLLGAVPAHVQTADYWAGYAGTKTVPPDQAARALTWVETDAPGAARISPYGVKTIMYTNPNRVMAGQPMSGSDEDEYAHTCAGSRARASASYSNQFLTNPQSDSVARMWRATVQRHNVGGHFDAVFDDDSVGAVYSLDIPCGYDLDAWLRNETDLERKLNMPVIYNGLNDFYDQGIAKEIILNAGAIGGMMEQCYATLRGEHRVNGWRWTASENTEIRMAQAGKYFFCYGRDLTSADQAYDSRMYTYASFLLTYDPRTSVLWEYYKTPSGGHVMPESQLVALDPEQPDVTRIDSLRSSGGAYVRRYRSCYLAGRSVGRCAVAVNPDAGSAHQVDLSQYSKTLSLAGSGVFDGGTVHIDNQAPSSTLAPLQAVIAIK